MSGLFEPMVNQKRSEFVAQQILEHIRKGTFKVGSRLPPERQIAEETGVSRPSVREAIVALQLLGVLESRPGSGTYVVRNLSDLEAAVDPLAFLSLVFRSGFSPFHILHARQVMEFGIVDALVGRVDADDLAAVDEVLGRMATAVEQMDYDAYDREDMAFHHTLARLTGNPVLEKMLSLLLKKMRDQLWQEIRQRYYFTDPHYFTAGLQVHRQIADALRRADRPAVHEAMRRHFDQSRWLSHVRESLAVKSRTD